MRTWGWGFFLRRTLPAAYPSRMTKSGVIGLSPTVPRTPSVPKYLRDICALCDLPCYATYLCNLRHSLVGLPELDDVPGFLHVVPPQYCRSCLQREQSHRQA